MTEVKIQSDWEKLLNEYEMFTDEEIEEAKENTKTEMFNAKEQEKGKNLKGKSKLEARVKPERRSMEITKTEVKEKRVNGEITKNTDKEQDKKPTDKANDPPQGGEWKGKPGTIEDGKSETD